MADPKSKTNLENLIDLLRALGESTKISVERIDSDPIRYDIGWTMPASLGCPSGPTIEEAAKNGLDLLIPKARAHYVECSNAVETIDRVLLGGRSP
jgi:hypothetical protein